MKRMTLILTALLACTLVAAPTFAGGGYGYRHGPQVRFGFVFGPYWGPWYGGPYYPPVVVQQTAPPVYIEQSSEPGAANYWYYCGAAKGYYPYVKDCPDGWQRVAPQPEDRH